MPITLQTINSATLSELKSFANANNILIEGDRRKKQSFINSITDYLVECGEAEVLAQEESANSTFKADITIEELETYEVAPWETEEAPVISGSRQESFCSDYQTDTSESTTNSSYRIEPKNGKLAFNQATPIALPMLLVLGTLALVIVPTSVVIGWLGTCSILLVKKAVPLVDQAMTYSLEGFVWLTELLFGEDDVQSTHYNQVKELFSS